MCPEYEARADEEEEDNKGNWQVPFGHPIKILLIDFK